MVIIIGVGNVLSGVGVVAGVPGTVIVVPRVLLVVLLGGIVVVVVLLGGSDGVGVGVGAVVDTGGEDTVLAVDEGGALVVLVVVVVIHSGVAGMQQTLIS